MKKKKSPVYLTYNTTTADVNDILWHYFHRTLFYQVSRDFLLWYLGSAYAAFSNSTSTKIITFYFLLIISQYREHVPGTVI